ncbi:MAG: hypothetical protein SGI71_08765 [Verrucomicrobiota bacterium]|nr:hypothetical protein [Verrucomicrobiota bacterium]
MSAPYSPEATRLILRAPGVEAWVCPELGGMVVKYAVDLGNGLVDVLDCREEKLRGWPDRIHFGNPILFPIVSWVRTNGEDNVYKVNGSPFVLPQHGFARKSVWTVENVSDTEVTLSLGHSDATLKTFPFKFKFTLCYRLKNQALEISAMVHNLSDATMPFAIGFHPYFNAPLSSASSKGACYLDVPECERISPLDSDWMNYSAIKQPQGRLAADTDLSGTFFYKNVEGALIRLVDEPSGYAVNVSWSNPHLLSWVAVWSRATDEKQVCIEPWTTGPNPVVRPDEMCHLLADESATCTLLLSLNRMT